jgi:hypothetical protein
MTPEAVIEMIVASGSTKEDAEAVLDSLIDAGTEYWLEDQERNDFSVYDVDVCIAQLLG